MAKRKPREKTEKCPECGQMFAPQGISLHLLKSHGYRAKKPEKPSKPRGDVPQSDKEPEDTRRDSGGWFD